MIKKINQWLFKRGWMVSLRSSAENYDAILQRLRNNQPFSFSRWGDGEWYAVLGSKGQNEANCDGHQYFDSMREELRKILNKKVPYMLGMQRLAYHKEMGREIDRYFKSNQINPKNLWWVDADVFHDASMEGKIMSFFQELKKKKILLVGPAYLRKFKYFNFEFVQIPPVNCWTERDTVMKEIDSVLRNNDIEVILFCAGMTSNWMVDQLHGKFPGFVLDIGSLLDPFVGKNTRNYHRKLAAKYPELNAPQE
jgi:hypothetical protein